MTNRIEKILFRCPFKIVPESFKRNAPQDPIFRKKSQIYFTTFPCKIDKKREGRGIKRRRSGIEAERLKTIKKEKRRRPDKEPRASKISECRNFMGSPRKETIKLRDSRDDRSIGERGVLFWGIAIILKKSKA
jgi:hypothetical protein